MREVTQRIAGFYLPWIDFMLVPTASQTQVRPALPYKATLPPTVFSLSRL